MTPRILITGSAGFIGSHLVQYVLDQTDWEVVCMDRLDHAGNLNRLGKIQSFVQHWGTRVGIVFHDLRASVNESAGVRLGTFDYIVHMAAGSHVDRSILDPMGFIQDNVIGSAHALDFARTHGLRRGGKFLYFSTDECFGPAPPGVSFPPWAAHNPQNPYAAAKSGGEMLCPSYAACYDLPIIITHCTNVIGPGQDAEKFIPRTIAALEAGRPVEIHYVNGTPCSRYYTHVENISSAVLFLLRNGTTLDGSHNCGRYNISGEREVSNPDLVAAIAKHMGVPAQTVKVERPPGRIKPDLRYCIDDSQTRREGWVQPVMFEEGLRRTVLEDIRCA